LQEDEATLKQLAEASNHLSKTSEILDVKLPAIAGGILAGGTYSAELSLNGLNVNLGTIYYIAAYFLLCFCIYPAIYIIASKQYWGKVRGLKHFFIGVSIITAGTMLLLLAFFVWSFVLMLMASFFAGCPSC
jgi:hypothetical protein